MSKFNLKFKMKSVTFYSEFDLLCQLAPSLEMTYMARLIFDVPAEKVRIINADESIIYRWDTNSKTWTI